MCAATSSCCRPSIGWANSPFQFEVGTASLGFPALGFIAAFDSFDRRLAAIIGSGIFTLGAAVGHVYQTVTAYNFAPMEYRKGKGKEAKLSYVGNALTENRHGLVVEAELGTATGTIEREAAMTMVVRHSPGSRRLALGADKAYDVSEFVDDLRDLNVTPHIAQNTTNRSAIDTRTTRHPGYAISQSSGCPNYSVRPHEHGIHIDRARSRHRPEIVAMASHSSAQISATC